MILRPESEPMAVVFREGIRGTESKSGTTGENEIRHFVNQNRAQKDTIFLPLYAQRMLETINPSNSERVLIWREREGRKLIWRMKIDEPEHEQRTEQRSPTATERMPQAAGDAWTRATQTQPRQIAAEPGGPHQMNYPPQPQRPEAQLMAACLYSAFDALTAAKSYIEDKRAPFAFDAGDVRSVAISMYIEACKQRADGRRAA